MRAKTAERLQWLGSLIDDDERLADWVGKQLVGGASELAIPCAQLRLISWKCEESMRLVTMSLDTAVALSETEPPERTTFNDVNLSVMVVEIGEWLYIAIPGGPVPYIDDAGNPVFGSLVKGGGTFSADEWRTTSVWIPVGEIRTPPLDQEGCAMLSDAGGALLANVRLDAQPLVTPCARFLANVLFALAERPEGLNVTEHRPSPKAQRKRGRRYFPGVEYVIQPDRPLHQNTGAGSEDPPEEGWTLSVRCLTRGHWRHQPYGKGSQLRKTKWIAPFWRGPEDAPLSIHATRIESATRDPLV